MVCYWFHCDCIFFGVFFSNKFRYHMCCWCVCHILFEHLTCILEFFHMIYFGSGIILVCAFSCPSGVPLFLLFSSENTCDSGYGVSVFIFPNLVFGHFSIFGVTIKYWLLIGWNFYQVFCWVQWLGFILVWIYNRHPQRFCIGEWIWLQSKFYLGSFLVHFLEFLLA